MKLHDHIDLCFQRFLEQMPESRVILLHPESHYRSVLVARLMNEPILRSFYYALGPDDIDLPAFLYSMTHDLAIQHPTFGRHLHTMPQNIYENVNGNFDQIVNAFARDLSEVNTEDFLFILDEYDRGDVADDIQRFIERLVVHLPPQCRMVINSRTLPRLPWVSMIARKEAVLLLDDHIIMRDFYGVEMQEDNKLEVYTLGPGFVLVDGHAIDEWEGHLPRLLFFFALDRPVVTRSEICQAFWPELDDDQAVNVFHVTKRRLHKALEADVLIHDEGYYRVNPELAVYFDATEFAVALVAGRDLNNPARVAAWQRAIDLYRGPFLQGHEEMWIQHRRMDFRAGYLEAMLHMAQVWIERGKREHALGLLLKATAEDPRREDVLREVMKLYTSMGRRSEATAQYQKLFSILRNEALEPEPETQHLYGEISS